MLGHGSTRSARQPGALSPANDCDEFAKLLRYLQDDRRPRNPGGRPGRRTKPQALAKAPQTSTSLGDAPIVRSQYPFPLSVPVSYLMRSRVRHSRCLARRRHSRQRPLVASSNRFPRLIPGDVRDWIDRIMAEPPDVGPFIPS